MKENFIQFIKFGFVGLSNTLINYIVYALCVRMGMHYLLSNALGFLISVLNAFFWNNKYVFTHNGQAKRCIWKSLIKSITAYSFNSLFLVSILLYIWINCLHISPYMAQLFNLIITIPLNFLINKFWAFK